MSNRGIINAASNPVINPASRQSLISSTAPLGVGLNEIRDTIATLNKFEKITGALKIIEDHRRKQNKNRS
jgi:hypothetical protein